MTTLHSSALRLLTIAWQACIARICPVMGPQFFNGTIGLICAMVPPRPKLCDGVRQFGGKARAPVAYSAGYGAWSIVSSRAYGSRKSGMHEYWLIIDIVKSQRIEFRFIILTIRWVDIFRNTNEWIPFRVKWWRIRNDRLWRKWPCMSRTHARSLLGTAKWTKHISLRWCIPNSSQVALVTFPLATLIRPTMRPLYPPLEVRIRTLLDTCVQQFRLSVTSINVKEYSDFYTP